MTDTRQTVGMVQCDECGLWHWATFSHVSKHGGADVYAVECTRDGLTDYYLTERVDFTRGAVS